MIHAIRPRGSAFIAIAAVSIAFALDAARRAFTEGIRTETFGQTHFVGLALVEGRKGLRADLTFRDRNAAGCNVFTFWIAGRGDEVGGIGSDTSRLLRTAVTLATFDDALPFAVDPNGQITVPCNRTAAVCAELTRITDSRRATRQEEK